MGPLGSTGGAECAPHEVESEVTPAMIEAGFFAMTTPLQEPWINAEFQAWLEATTRGQHELNPVVTLLLKKVYRKMHLASAAEKEQEPLFQQRP